FMGKLHDMVNWGRKNSIWPYNFGLSCCYVEMVTSFTAVHDVAHEHVFVNFLLQGVGYDLLFLQGVTVILTVRIYAGERIIHL
ncbi:hypothetical protein ONR07_24670, partial [Salmonella enterica subsp. enterica serovar Anatum]|nr:hypothetical protein [Salmonella enterica subsp. enterica serovar Anatum]